MSDSYLYSYYSVTYMGEGVFRLNEPFIDKKPHCRIYPCPILFRLQRMGLLSVKVGEIVL